MEMGGTAACALNAANEITVQAFLDQKIGFLDIATLNEETLFAIEHITTPRYEDYVTTDRLARDYVTNKIEK